MSSSPSATSSSTSLHTLADIGKRYFESHNSQVNLLTNIEPLMLPPAPKQKQVDCYSEKDLKTNRKKDYDLKRVDYEAECDVYGALECLDGRITVLHSFKYTCQQWIDFVGQDKNAKPKDGEHDFVVIIPNIAVICIEVKRPKRDKNYQSLYSDAYRECSKFGDFFRCLLKHCDGENLRYQKFCAFPHANEKDLSNNEVALNKKDDVPILWKEDIQNISRSLNRYFGDFNKMQSESDVEALLVGFWLKHSSGFKDIRNTQGLTGNTIKDINERLKRQELYLKEHQRSENLAPIPKTYKRVFADHLYGIKYITQEQKKLLEIESQKGNPIIFKKPYIFVNGFAGSGKTLIVYARILKLLECMGKDEQILMLLPWEDAAQRFMEIVKKFDVSVTVEIIDLLDDIREHKDNPNVNLTTLLSEKMEGCSKKVVIFVRPNFHLDFGRKFVVSIQKGFLKMLKDKKWHIFCDDFQSTFANSMLEPKTGSRWVLPSSSTDFLFDLLSNDVRNIDQKPRSLWISCDLMQTVQSGFWGKDVLHQAKGTFDCVIDLCCKHIDVSLSGNLRNHHGIALLLIELIKKFLEMSEKNRDKLQQILPRQGFNHHIQGFTTKLYCVLGRESNLAEDRMTEIIRKELKFIHNSYEAAADAALNNFKLAVIRVYIHISDDVTPAARKKLFENIRSTVILASELEGLKDFDITKNFVDYVKYAVSIEFPCAVLIVDLSSPRSKDSAHSSESFQHSLMNILAHIYVGVSRARVYCSIILVCSDEEPNELYKEVLNILKPHVKTIEVRQKDMVSSMPVHSSSHNRQTHYLPFRTFATSKRMAVLILCDRRNDSFDCSQLRKPIIAYKCIIRFLEDLNRHSEKVHKADIVLISAGIYDIKTNGVSASMLHDHVRDFLSQFPTTQFIFESVTTLKWDGSREHSETNKTIYRFNELMFQSSLDHDNIEFFDHVRFNPSHLSADGRDLSTAGQAELSKCWIHCILIKSGIRQGDLPIRRFRNMMTGNQGTR